MGQSERPKPGGPRPKPNMVLLRKRIEHGLSREALGDLVGISAKQVGLIERGVAVHSREDTLCGIATALETPAGELFDLNRRLLRRKPKRIAK